MPVDAGETQTPSVGGAADAGGGDVALEVAAGGAVAARGALLPDRRGVSGDLNIQGAPCSETPLSNRHDAAAAAGTTFSSLGTAGTAGTTVGPLGTASRPVSTVGTAGTTVSIVSKAGTPSSTVGISGTTIGSLGTAGTPVSIVGTAGAIIGSLSTAGTPMTIVSKAGTPSSTVGTAGTAGGSLGTAGTPVSTVGTAGATSSSLGTAGTSVTAVGTVGATVGPLGTAGRPVSTVGTAGTPVSIVGTAGTIIGSFGTAGTPVAIVSKAGTPSSSVGISGTTVGSLGTAGTPVSTVGTAGTTLSIVGTAGAIIGSLGTAGTPMTIVSKTGTPSSTVGTAGTAVGTAGTPVSTVGTAGATSSSLSTAGTPVAAVGTVGRAGTTVGPLGTAGRPVSTVGTAGTPMSIMGTAGAIIGSLGTAGTPVAVVSTAGTPSSTVGTAGATIGALGTAGTSSSAVVTAGTPVYINLHTSGVSSTPSSTVPKIVISAGRLGSELPAAIGTRSSPAALPPKAAGQGGVGVSLATASQVGVARLATISQVPGKETVITLPRAATPQASGGQRGAQGASVQLPANFQIPQGMMLIRSESGQLMLVSQQALAQAQAQGIIPRAAGTANGSVARAAAPQGSAAAAFKKADAAAAVRAPPVPSSTPGTSYQKMSVLKVRGYTAGQTVRPAVPPQSAAPLVIPTKTEGPKTAPVATISAETLENVKKCKNFLVTLIKLASSGTHSAEMAKNVKELVKSLLDGKIEPEEFTDRLYMELKSSPQPYLVPFLKRSLPAVRQLTPNSQLFIQQCAPLSSTKPTPVPAAVPPMTGAAVSKTLQANAGVNQPLKATQATRPTQLVIQQPRGVVIKQSAVPASAQSKAAPKQLVTALQTTSHPTGAAVKQSPLQVSRIISLQPPQVQKIPFKDTASASFRDEDDINDVASMAGVNLNEENARILATNSEHVGTIVRSCRDDPFLSVAALQKRIVEIGKRHGVADIGTDVVSLVSYATQERLRELVEKLTAVAQHRNASYKDDLTYRQTTDTRSQLRFLEQLDRLERRRKEEEEREVLLRIAKSRSNREDPELLRLKQKAKEMQQLELAQTQQRDANLTALAAIGPRKKRPLESLGYGSGNEAPGALASSASSVVKQSSVHRVTRVSLRDLVFCMEQDPALRHSLCLYRALIR
ncbi:transcription initiation factor TFIID subunit 4-like [Scleropages formosus]|uniref:transcription initiation factor TFIID subunit 4-like n=1 Tax=Scleropages formosus TaxID=113540 RepID=UPI0010FA90DD|nr:transcription initiation factor TFIID subunit 4-like [Scleropages formosus]